VILRKAKYASSQGLSKRPDTIVNNGHTIQLGFVEGDRLNVGHRTYALKQFHFHHPSEHLIDGRGYAMEATAPGIHLPAPISCDQRPIVLNVLTAQDAECLNGGP